jgi:NitT/TauT family transport system ATP-binding protein
VLELTDLTKSYGRGPAARTAISGLNLIVAPGELVSIVGPVYWRRASRARAVPRR